MDPGIAYSVLAAFVWGVYIFALKRYFPGYSGAVLTVVVNAFAVLLYLPVTAVTYDPAAVPSLAELGATCPTSRPSTSSSRCSSSPSRFCF